MIFLRGAGQERACGTTPAVQIMVGIMMGFGCGDVVGFVVKCVGFDVES